MTKTFTLIVIGVVLLGGAWFLAGSGGEGFLAKATNILGGNSGGGVTCDPALAPNKQNSCNLEKFLLLVRAVTLTILKLTLVIGPLLIAAGGIAIMSAGGSESRRASGKKIITAAVVGIAIALGSYLIIVAVYTAFELTPPVATNENITSPP